MRWSSAALVCVITCACRAWGDVPPPSETPATVVVSGLTTTALEIVVVKVGQEIPDTYAAGKSANTEGFDWYVSQHYALKSNMGDDFSREMLEISELAYPQWVALTGLRPPNPNKRMCIVYGSDRQHMAQAMKDDVGGVWDGPGGGIVIWNNMSAYNYPSGTLKYHRRDLVIHENLHMLQGVCLGNMGTENITYAAANHVYDEEKRQLTVACFDKATINNPIDEGLTALQQQPWSLTDRIDTVWREGGAIGALYQQFLWTDPDRCLKWRIWRDELYDGRLEWAPNADVMAGIYGPLGKLNEEWLAWLQARHHSYHHVQWGWEQSGNTLWSYGWPWNPDAYSQIDLRYRPCDPADYDPLRMDFPAQPMPPIVGPVSRGVEEPTVGCVVDFRRDPDRGQGGLGFGVDGESHCPITIDARRQLLVGGYTSGIPRQAFDIPEDLRQAASGDGHRYGLTVRIARQALDVTVRAGIADAIRETVVSVPITPEQRETLTSRYMAVIAKGGYQGVTPFVDDVRAPAPDLTEPAPANRWRFAGWDRLYGLYRASYDLGDAAPQSLLSLKESMLTAVGGSPDEQARAVTLYEERIAEVAGDLRRHSAESVRIHDALSALAGMTLRLAVKQAAAPDEAILTATLAAADFAGAEGAITFEGGVQPTSAPVSVMPSGQAVVERTVQVDLNSLPATLTATASLASNGQAFTVRASRCVGTSIPGWHVIGPFDNPGGGAGDVQHSIETAPPDLDGTYAGQGAEVRWRVVERGSDLPITAEHVVDFGALFGRCENAAAYGLTILESDREQQAMLALGSDDGVVAWLNGAEVCRHLLDRGYGPRQERVGVHLRRGRNVLVVKITQGGGDWKFSAEVLGTDGAAPQGVRCVDP
jgi:hypothetical protein